MTSHLWNSHLWFTGEDPATVRPVLDLDYAAGHVAAPFDPIEDDQHLRNDVTAERVNGSSARSEQLTGPLSVNDPPVGVGRYDESVQLNVFEDLQLPDQASWRVHLGTVDEIRYPNVPINLARNLDLVEQVAAIESGDRTRIANTPSWLPPGDVDLLVQGYSERLTPFEWEWTANTSPGSSWTVAVTDDEVLGRLETSGSQLAGSMTTTQTSVSVTTTGGPTWIDTTGFGTEFPFDVLVGGEVMTVTAVTGASSPQTFTVTRSVNGIVKTHAAGVPVAVAQPAVVAL